jgi:hypothetical protein
MQMANKEKITPLSDVLMALFYFCSLNLFNSNGSGSKELTTIRNGRIRHIDTSGTVKESVPIPPTMNDKYIDLMALVLGRRHHSEKTLTGYEKVIIKTETDDSNPSLADIMDIKLR